ncbi:MAG TPA: TAT-variant-translocated molybdopterin oxidoreductase [Verrucomicrobiae bacterium]|jgi:molybdopterin-containing oxidoreductase family iron-sulfur binding subunit|nr:TAT-variant-translocated molybdopterin oxidoreductase [Verrucomicrobiae bacterium]
MKTTQPIEPASRLDLAAIRVRLNGVRGQDYWRSLEEIADTREFREMLHREFPAGAFEWWDGLSRRNFLKMSAATMALAGLNACTKQPTREIYPYVNQPQGMVLGDPLYYATSMLMGGFATGVLAKSREGHPIKVDGNPEHPASLGGSSVWMQASILNLYDPDRSQTVTHNGDISTWALFLSDLDHGLDGRGLRFLTETVTSPTLAAHLNDLIKQFPGAKWHQYDPITRDNIRDGARLAFGEFVETHYQFDKANVILSLDADFLCAHPQRLRYTRHFADGRRVSGGRREMSRLYVVESTPTVTGTMAEHRLPMEGAAIEDFARQVAQQLGAQAEPGHNQFLDELVKDLRRHQGSSIVIAGEWQPPVVHALAHRLNQILGNVGNTVYYSETAEAQPVNQLESLRELVGEMKTGAVKTLFILGGNPVYTAPVDLDFGEHLKKVERSIHLGLGLDETGALCTWHVPETHYLESWGDARAFDGTVSLMQPLIAPLYDGKSASELLGVMKRQQPIQSDYEILRDYWRKQNPWPDFEAGWRKAICDGFIGGSGFGRKEVSVNSQTFLKTSQHNEGFEVIFRPDPNLWDGRFANNGWLHECPKPINKLTWDNAVYISPKAAERLKLTNNDNVKVTFQGRAVVGPVWVMPGQAENTITLPLGYGRARAGRVGDGVGFNAYSIRPSDAPWIGLGATLERTGETHLLVGTQTHFNVESAERQIYRDATLEELRASPDVIKKSVEEPGSEETLYYPKEYPYEGYKWGMSIDLTSCIGCNACLIACEVENNIPVVGKEQVHKNREMHWIRIDTYYKGSLDNPGFNHMPTPCMQCEHAPCELVCPVEATVHDSEGLNVQIYQRCVGTRFCSNNCPYKVRRFNFLRYTDYNMPNFKPMYNPEVTVRWRGVMEKCTYCVQRISAARITAEKENRRIRDGEVRTACQQACPAQAIVFGDLNTPGSQVAQLKSQPTDYSMLGELNTRPRTTYLAKITNPNSEAQQD